MKGIDVPFKDAGKLAPEAIYNFAKKVFLERGPADGIYMLGAGWHNLPVIEMLEKDLKTTVLSSIPAQVWATKKILHLNEPLTGYGRLLAEMP
jgi:maleate cis-trans isomerase